jgi:hypothetical protein
MRGLITFHAVDPLFFETLIEPLAAGEKINPEGFLEQARRVHRAAWITHRYKRTLEDLLGQLEPPPPPEQGTLWEKVRARLERFDHRPGALACLVGAHIEPQLHLYGRPFLITEGSAERVAEVAAEYARAGDERSIDALVLDQLVRLDAQLGREIEPTDCDDAAVSLSRDNDLLGLLRQIHELARAARGGPGQAARDPGPARERLAAELPWLAVLLHSRAHPFWIARDVDGLVTLCRAAGIEPPDFLTSARRLFRRACEAFPDLGGRLRDELDQPKDVGAFVAPPDVVELLAFLNEQGSRIIRIATQYGDGPACSLMLRKVRECARLAERQGHGYLEASGIGPLIEDAEAEFALEEAAAR